jgi:hypothetical protein
VQVDRDRRDPGNGEVERFHRHAEAAQVRQGPPAEARVDVAPHAALSRGGRDAWYRIDDAVRVRGRRTRDEHRRRRDGSGDIGHRRAKGLDRDRDRDQSYIQIGRCLGERRVSAGR